MKIQVTQVLKDFFGEALKGPDGKEVTLRSVIIGAITYEDEKHPLTAEQKVRAYKVGGDVASNDEVDLKAEDIVQIKKGAEIAYKTIIYGQLIDLLEEDNNDATNKTKK